jgi:DNA-binding NtrC family response regulator
MLASMPTTASVRVLLVDDDARTLDLFCDALRMAGYEVDGLPTATAALDALSQRRYHVVISDNILPDIQGVELLAAMRGAMPTTPLILYSGDITETIREQAKDFGVYAVLEKPISLAHVDVVRSAVGKAPQVDQPSP